MSKFTDQGRIEAYLKRELTTHETDALDDVIEFVSNQIETYTGRNWSDIDEDAPTVAEDRYFSGSGAKELYIDDFLEVESVVILDGSGSVLVTVSDETKWTTYPSNKQVQESIRLREYRFPNGSSNVKIRAVWSSGDLPVDVKFVATALAASKFGDMGDKASLFKKESIEGYSYERLDTTSKDEDTKALLSQLSHWLKISL